MIYIHNLIILIFLIILIVKYIYNIEPMVNIPNINESVKWTRNKNCNYKMTKTLSDVLEKNTLYKTDNNDWNVYFPCTYNRINDEISSIDPKNNSQRLFIINNADQIVRKNNIWNNLVNTYGRDIECTLMPKKYILSNPIDIKLFNKEYNT